MRTHHDVNREPEPLPQASPPGWEKQAFPGQSFQPPQPPPRPKRHPWAAIAAVALVFALALGLGVAFVPGLVRSPGGQVTPTPAAPTAPGTATTPEPVTPGTDGVIPAPVGPGTEITPAPAPGVVLGPRACPAGIGDPARWNALIGTNNGERQVVSVSCANIMDNPSQQAMVLVRHTNANNTLDVYVFNNITNAHPTRIFLLQGLIKGNARISGYNTIMTAEVDRDAAHNAGKPVSAMTPDLFREFDWSAGVGAFTQVAFPGMYPDLTRYQAEADQRGVKNGQDSWKDDAVQTTQHMVADLLAAHGGTAQVKLVKGGGKSDLTALVQVTFPAERTQNIPITRVTLARLEGNLNGIWEVTAVQADWLRLDTPTSGAKIGSPVMVTGFGPQFEAQIGVVYILDHLYQKIQVGDNFARAPDGASPPSSFKLPVKYTSSFKGGAQEGIVELVHGGGAAFDYGAVLTKVLISG